MDMGLGSVQWVNPGTTRLTPSLPSELDAFACKVSSECWRKSSLIKRASPGYQVMVQEHASTNLATRGRAFQQVLAPSPRQSSGYWRAQPYAVGTHATFRTLVLKIYCC